MPSIQEQVDENRLTPSNHEITLHNSPVINNQPSNRKPKPSYTPQPEKQKPEFIEKVVTKRFVEGTEKLAEIGINKALDYVFNGITHRSRTEEQNRSLDQWRANVARARYSSMNNTYSNTYYGYGSWK